MHTYPRALGAGGPRPVSSAAFAVNAGGEVTAWDDGAQALFGHTAHEVLGRRLAVFRGAQHRRFERAVSHARETLEPLSLRLAAETAGGERLLVSVELQPLGHDGYRMHVVARPCVPGAAGDHPTPGEPPPRGEQRYRSLFEHNPEACFSLDVDGRFTDVNARATELTGYPVDELVGLHSNVVIDPAQLPEVRRFFELTLTGEPQRYELQGRRRDGGAYIAEVTSIPIVIDEQVVGVHGIAKDVTAERQAQRLLRESEDRYHQLFEHSIDGVILMSADGDILAANRAACEIFQRSEAELARCGRTGIVDSDDPRATTLIDHRSRTGHARGEVTMRRADGELFDAEVASAAFEDSQGETRVSVVVRDVTERRRAERELRLAANALSNTAEGVMITDTRNRIVSVNAAFTKITGYASHEALGRRPGFLGSGLHGFGFHRDVWSSIRREGLWQGEMWNRRKDGEIFPTLVSTSAVRDEAGTLTHYVTVFNDITEYKDFEERLELLTHHDPLTHLANRAAFEERLHRSLGQARRTGGCLALLFVDLDHFKTVNDSLGHGAGDRLLKAVSERLVSCVRESDAVARLGGDEFTIVLDDLTRPRDAVAVAQKILDTVSEPMVIDGRSLFTSVSIGISCYPADGMSVENLMKNADAALYKAKHQGRNSYQFYASEMNTQAFETLYMANGLRQALASEAFHLEYQPIVDMRDGRVTAAEALLRWRHPELGSIPPGRFIPVAEDTGLIGVIGEWALKEACLQVRRWQRAGLEPVRMAVNLSARQLSDPGFVQRLLHILADTDMMPEYLELEITESMLMENPERARAQLNALHSLGVTIAIDDFGTGYSSLTYLKDFPADYLKIDRTFVQGITHDADDMAITTTIIAMARSMKLSVIAEGIESEEQQSFLLAEGCIEGQGFLYSRSRPADEFARLLSAGVRVDD